MSYVKPIPRVASRFDIPKAQSEEINREPDRVGWISAKMVTLIEEQASSLAGPRAGP